MKTWAILYLTNLKIKQFGDKDSMKDAMNVISQNNIPVVVLKYYPEINQYKVLEHH
jgi:hypothetical protein